MEEKVIIRLTFNPRLVLTAFQTILPCFQQVKQTILSPRSNRKLALGQRST